MRMAFGRSISVLPVDAQQRMLARATTTTKKAKPD
jgi:hypothetical protein